MEAIKVRATNDEVVITIDKKVFSEEEILTIINHYRIKKMVRDADVDPKIMELAKEIKHNIWEEVKKEIGFKKANS